MNFVVFLNTKGEGKISGNKVILGFGVGALQILVWLYGCCTHKFYSCTST